ncbi:hypothetical protein K504DRAFT_438260 [Pleomassaria siparia CBS 279.74]|uniref:Rhodopsin domain-containing protein n=1 Tax=Pleomassaria siparia CBS 279.74 TaxID=1314801 RepID=A0A6G1K115_9PLEO|nr:hypothetical protein K504DRAFT_438260 [Pleomassaria siparia CBS 279.74]
MYAASPADRVPVRATPPELNPPSARPTDPSNISPRQKTQLQTLRSVLHHFFDIHSNSGDRAGSRCSRCRAVCENARASPKYPPLHLTRHTDALRITMALGETDQQVLFLGLGWGFYGFAVLICLVRFYVRFFMIRIPGADDYILMGTLVAATGVMVLFTLQCNYALGQHAQDVTVDDLQKTLQVYYGAVLCYMFAIGLVKITIVVQHMRIFRVFPIICYICWGVFIFLILWLLGTLLCIVAFCRISGPLSWNSDSVSSKCEVTTWLVHAAISIGTDCFMILLPIPAVWQMRNPPRQKVAICCLFAVGGVACTMSCLRVVSLTKIAQTSDLSYDTIWPSIWTALEIDIAIICAALMAIRPLLIRWIPALRREAFEATLPPLDHITDGPPTSQARRKTKFKTVMASISESFGSSLKSGCWEHNDEVGLERASGADIRFEMNEVPPDGSGQMEADVVNGENTTHSLHDGRKENATGNWSGWKGLWRQDTAHAEHLQRDVELGNTI